MKFKFLEKVTPSWSPELAQAVAIFVFLGRQVPGTPSSSPIYPTSSHNMSLTQRGS